MLLVTWDIWDFQERHSSRATLRKRVSETWAFAFSPIRIRKGNHGLSCEGDQWWGDDGREELSLPPLSESQGRQNFTQTTSWWTLWFLFWPRLCQKLQSTHSKNSLTKHTETHHLSEETESFTHAGVSVWLTVTASHSQTV